MAMQKGLAEYGLMPAVVLLFVDVGSCGPCAHQRQVTACLGHAVATTLHPPQAATASANCSRQVVDGLSTYQE